MILPAQQAAAEVALSSYWPQAVSHDAYLKIGEVLGILKAEFPFLAASKIRYFESQGLLHPQRTASNQRQFSPADVERLRFILGEQRDRYLNLPQIKEMLRQLDSGEVVNEHPGKMRALGDKEIAAPRSGTRLHKEELATLTGVPIAKLEEYLNAGLLSADARGRLTAQSIDLVRYAQILEERGVDIRFLKAVRNGARSHAVAILNSLAIERARKSPLAKERALADTAEISAALSNYYRAQLLENLDIELR